MFQAQTSCWSWGSPEQPASLLPQKALSEVPPVRHLCCLRLRRCWKPAGAEAGLAAKEPSPSAGLDRSLLASPVKSSSLQTQKRERKGPRGRYFSRDGGTAVLEVLSREGALVVWQISGENVVCWEKRGQIPSATSAAVHKVTVDQCFLAPRSLSVKPRAQKVPMLGKEQIETSAKPLPLVGKVGAVTFPL